jgi:hypothetical protein
MRSGICLAASFWNDPARAGPQGHPSGPLRLRLSFKKCVIKNIINYSGRKERRKNPAKTGRSRGLLCG